MEQNKKQGLLGAVLAVIALLLLAWLGSSLGWWSFGDGTGTNSGATPRPSSGSTNINNFYTDVRNERNEDNVSDSSQDNNLSKKCTVTVNTTEMKREVCVYTSDSGTGTVTVTSENDKVVSVTKSGF